MPIDAPEATKPLRVYLVEDSQILRPLLVSLIEAGGGEVIGSSDGASAAIADLSSLRPDVIVTNIGLASGNGFDLLKALRDHNLASDAVKMVLTNYAAPEFKDRSIRLGADRFFDKSETWRALMFIRELAARRKATRHHEPL